MNRRRQFLWKILGIALVGYLATNARGATHISVRDKTKVASTVVRLGDVAEVACADRATGRQLSALPLMPAPPPGTERFLRRQEIADLLAARGCDLRDFQFDGAGQVAISAPQEPSAPNSRSPRHGELANDRAATGHPMNRHAAILAAQISGSSNDASEGLAAKQISDDLNSTITRYLEDQTGRVGDWRVACDVAGGHLALLQAATTPAVCQGGREPWIGQQRFVISFATAQGNVQIPVYAVVTTDSARVAVAARPIARGEVITAADVEMNALDSAPPTGRRAGVNSLEQLTGMEARQAIQLGEVIYADQVQSPLLVKRGEEITVVAQGGGIRVRTKARARQDGSRGQLVQVEALESKERYDVRVVGLREAEVFTATIPASMQIPTATAETGAPLPPAPPFQPASEQSPKAGTAGRHVVPLQ